MKALRTLRSTTKEERARSEDAEEARSWPHQSKPVYKRYHVMNHAARVALDEHWKRHFEERPEARARFEEAFALYISWIRGAARQDVR
jgi:hypothetical protein